MNHENIIQTSVEIEARKFLNHVLNKTRRAQLQLPQNVQKAYSLFMIDRKELVYGSDYILCKDAAKEVLEKFVELFNLHDSVERGDILHLIKRPNGDLDYYSSNDRYFVTIREYYKTSKGLENQQAKY